MKDGKIIAKLSNGCTFEGTYKDDNMKEGIYYFKDSRSYTGNFRNNLPTGNGIL